MSLFGMIRAAITRLPSYWLIFKLPCLIEKSLKTILSKANYHNAACTFSVTNAKNTSAVIVLCRGKTNIAQA